jgi:hypothetical protein
MATTPDIAATTPRLGRDEIDPASFRTGNPRRDASVLAQRVLDPEHHPVISFDSERPGTRDIPGPSSV